MNLFVDRGGLMGYDSDHPRSLGEMGKCGLAVDSMVDIETLFQGSQIVMNL